MAKIRYALILIFTPYTSSSPPAEVLRQTNASSESTPAPAPKHDVLEVDAYFASGLVVSTIDRWFVGAAPRFSEADLGVRRAGVPGAGREAGLAGALQAARAKLQSGLVWPPVSV